MKKLFVLGLALSMSMAVLAEEPLALRIEKSAAVEGAAKEQTAVPQQEGKDETGLASFYTFGFGAILNAPNGKVVHKIPATGSYVVTIDRIEKGYAHIQDNILYECEEAVTTHLKGSKTGYWIRASELMGKGMGDGAATLYSQPDEKSGVAYVSNEDEQISPLEIRGEWVKVQIAGTQKVGWVKASQICSNPLTNCC